MTGFDSWVGSLHRGLGWVARWPGAVVVVPDDPAHVAGAERMLREIDRDADADRVREVVTAYALRGELRAVAYVAEPVVGGGLVGFSCGLTEVIGDGRVLLNGTGPLQEQPIEVQGLVTVRAANLQNAARPVALFDLRLGVAPGAGISLSPVGAPVGSTTGPATASSLQAAAARPAPPPGRDLPPPPPDGPARPPVGRLPANPFPDDPIRPEPPTAVPAPAPVAAEPFVSVLLGPGPAQPVEALAPLPTFRPVVAEPASGPAGHPAPSHRIAASAPPISDDDVEVQGILCSRHHFNNPSANYCMVCGISMVHLTHNLVPGPRPTLGFIVFDNGSTYGLDRSYIIGREPGQVAEAHVAALAIHDDNETLSRRHAEIRLVEWDAHILDLGSTNGTFVWDVSFNRWNQISPNQPVPLSPGDTVALGRRTFVFESVSRP